MKHCNGCNQDLLIENFGWRNKSKGWRLSRCKNCRNIAQHSEPSRLNYKNKYKNDPEERHRVKCRVKKYRNAKRSKILEYLKKHPCIDCGETDIIVLEFDHIDPKKKTIEIGGAFSWSWDKILQEIQKCEVRCANCHRRKTAKEQNWYKLI